MSKQIPLVLALILLLLALALIYLLPPAPDAPWNWPLVSWYGALAILSAGIIGYGITWIGRKHR
jgi:hypothetical protein